MEAAYELERTRLDRLRRQIEEYKLFAPIDGTMRPTIIRGATVRER